MRKIDIESSKAFNGGYDFKSSNTSVKTDPWGVYMYLHDHCIAKKVYGDGTYLSHCDWETTTTKARLNGILSMYQDKSIYQKDFQWYLRDGDKTIEFTDGWNKI